MKHFWGYLLLSFALHVSVGWLLHGLRAEPEPLAWQPPMAIQLVSLEPVAKPMAAPVAQPEPARQPITLPKAFVPAKTPPVPAKPLPISPQPAIVKASPPPKPQPPTAQKPSPPQRDEPRPVQPASSASSTAQNTPPAAPVKAPVTLPPATITPAPALTPVVSLRPSFVTPPPAPRYPNTARRRNQQGIVRVEVHLDERGQQLKLLLSRSSGVESLDAAALEAVRNWRFRPEIVDGRAVPSRVEIPIEFALTANR
ncbi:TPA: energy transducer TonB [Pseudomonas putida]|nr:energy transducer TonB [Pseudomonas putida]